MPENVYPPPDLNQPQPQVTGVASSTEVPSAPVVTSQRGILSKKNIIIAALVLVILLVIALAVSFFLGRGRRNEIVWWGLWEEAQVVQPLIDEYQSQNPNVKISFLKQSKEDYRERLTNALAKGEGPDIFRFHNSWVPMFRRDLDVLPSEVMSPSEFAQTFYPTASVDLTNGKEIVGIPLEYDALTLFINEDIFSQNGKNPPATWDDLRALAQTLTTRDDQGVITQSGVALGRTENVDHWPEIIALMMLQNGVDLSTPTGKAAEDALKFFTIFSNVDGVWDTSLPSSTTAFAGGKLAMYFGPSWEAFTIYHLNPSLKFRAVALPQLPKTQANEPNVSYASYWAEGVWSRSAKKEEAWKFLKFLSTRESLEKFYTNAAKTRAFGEPYPRVDMAELIKTQPIIGPLTVEAPVAQSWYLQARTFDGPTGINSQLNKYFEDAINSINNGVQADKALEPVASGVSQILGRYGLVAR